MFKKRGIYLAVVLLLGCGVCLYGFYRANAGNIPFEPQGWQSDVELRHLMRKDLVKNHLKMGTPSQEVEKILGKPDRIILGSGMSKEFHEKRPNVELLWEYRMSMNIDPGPMFLFDCHVFRVGFDKNEKCSDTHVFIN